MANNGMWLPAEDDPRVTTPAPRGERENLAQYLNWYRDTLRLKCEGLTPEQLGRRSVPPSILSLLGLVRHMARVEQSWFRRVIEGRPDLVRLHANAEGGDGSWDFPEPTHELVDEAFAELQAEIEHAQEVLKGVDLGALVMAHGHEVEVRDIVVHMIEEYARHCGHADLLRECIDGRTGA